MKIIHPLRNSESKASGNKRSSKDPDDQIWDALILLTKKIDGESSKAELLQSSVHLEILLQLFWCLLDKNQSRFDSNKTREAAAEAGRLYNYTKRAFTG